MGSGETSKYNLEYPVSTDPTNVPGDQSTAMDQIDLLLAPVYTGTLADLPAVGKQGRFYVVAASDATNYGQAFLDTGTAWIAWGVVNCSTNAAVGSAALISTSAPGNSALRGTSPLSAAADHRHVMAAWGSNSDQQPDGPNGVAGSSGRFADAQHVHPGSRVGDVTWTLATTPCADEVIANGQVLSQATYPALYALATSQGWPQNSPGSGNFNVIDLRAVSPIGAGNSFTLGQTYGSATVTIGQSNLPAHTHNGTTATESASHSHDGPGFEFTVGSVPQSTLFINSGANVDHGNNTNVTYTISTEGESNTHTHTFTTGPGPGSATPLSILGPVVGCTPMIKAL